ncbi:hypothetical protein [Pseudoalteromonas phenolica]|uniref:Peptidase M61 catalytic domain-containing protein n=1 Tax=Pseudoalteromonas phenolica TaxID=161398 RepID=A0A0S2K7R6_9GAMM|nr:hypothetical protein [Pseudoalteromonas phenolica]ALO44232.1 hypothetical protein PP2015_3760 [Pseudoalteromonas phenolica]MBE0357224.1 hypothetical protein [Pseudoalteromonas phenolica O-BC30]
MFVFLLFVFSQFSLSTQLVYAQADFIGLSKLNESQKTKVKSWINYGLEATQKTLGPLKQKAVPIYLEPQYFAFEAVPWAEVIRGSQDGVELQFSRYASLKQLKNDWTLYHELAHLYHPLLNYKDFWISEGLATFLQNQIMKDSGVITHENMMMRIKAGLERGKANTYRLSYLKDARLSSVASNMWQLNAQQRVYWSGVAFFIEAQYKLKQQNAQFNSIVELINAYQACCKMSQQQSGKDFLRSLDKLSKTAIFTNLYFKYSVLKEFPVISKQQLNQI